MSVTLTDKAVNKIKAVYSEDNSIAGKPLRVSVQAGGCSGYSYGFSFDEKDPADLVQGYQGFELIIDPKSDSLLNGSVIDYHEDFGEEGFAVSNPNARQSCGCGHSFAA